jgi:pimeloyl-ACP methyl ester carboxylesterase
MTSFFKFHGLAFFVLTIVLLSACNPAKHILSNSHRQYEKLDLKDWTSELDSSTVYWRKVGYGDQKLILIHGFGAGTELQWEKLVKLLAQDFTMYIPDLIYFGNSTSNYDVYDPRFIARQLFLSLPKDSSAGYYVAGISFGGLISSIIAHNYPQKTQGLILMDALSIFADNGHTDSLAKAYGYENISELLIPKNGKALKTMLEVSFYKPKKYPAFLLNKPAQTLYADQRTEKEELLEFMQDHASEIKKLDIRYEGPVRIIWGAEDKIIPLDNGRKLHAFYPESELFILPKVGHVSNMEDPEMVAEIIRNMAGEK